METNPAPDPFERYRSEEQEQLRRNAEKAEEVNRFHERNAPVKHAWAGMVSEEYGLAWNEPTGRTKLQWAKSVASRLRTLANAIHTAGYVKNVELMRDKAVCEDDILGWKELLFAINSDDETLIAQLESSTRRPYWWSIFRGDLTEKFFTVDSELPAVSEEVSAELSAEASKPQNWVILSPAALQKMFGYGPDMIRSLLMSQQIENIKITSKSYWVNPARLPTGWEKFHKVGNVKKRKAS